MILITLLHCACLDNFVPRVDGGAASQVQLYVRLFRCMSANRTYLGDRLAKIE